MRRSSWSSPSSTQRRRKSGTRKSRRWPHAPRPFLERRTQTPRSRGDLLIDAALPKFYTITQAADVLACSEKQIGRLIKAGRLAAVDIGTGRSKELRIPHDALYALGSPTSSP